MREPIDPDRWRVVSGILDDVLDLPPDARASRLDEACGSDVELRRDVEDLIAASESPDGFLSTPAVERAAPLIAEVAPDPHGASIAGQRVGPYRLVRALGAGGMAVVWLAEREDGQFQQQVAIKFVKQGLLSLEAQRRFLQERQILARLQHPSIARLLDGGVTPQGAPYFVMELVEGVPVTSHCRDRGLDVEGRLRVFLQICDAVQYAHRNLIVHRDLKPSNILVDGEDRVKLLDFGIAKLLGDAQGGRDGAPQTIERALTPEYAAPEQLRDEPISTSTDVYALGVLLYELLTGERPYAVRGSAVREIERAILEQAPAAPSARASTPAFRRRLRGDLDRIVLKALQKAPERRYPSAEAFAADVRRHLEGLPISARGDALSYRARKFFGRHRLATAAAAMLFVTLVGGLVATMWQARRAAREAQKADAVKDFLKTILAAADPDLTGGKEPSVRQLLDAGAQRIEAELRNQADVQSEVASVIGAAYQSLGEYDRAAALFRADLERRRRLDGPRGLSLAGPLRQLGDALYEQSRFTEAAAVYEQSLGIEREKRGSRTPQVAELLWDLGGVARNRGELARAEALDRESLALYSELAGQDSAQAIGVRESLGILYAQVGRFAEAAALQAQVAAARERYLSADHPHTLNSRYNLAYAFVNLGRFEDAVRVSEDVVARQRRVLGPRHDRLAVSLRILARALDQAGRAEDALAPAAEALAIQTAEFGPVHPQVAIDRVWQAVVEMHTARLAKAEEDARSALAYFDIHPDPGRADAPHLRTLVGSVLAESGHLDEADAQISRAAADLRAAHHENVFLGFALDALGDVARRRAQAARARALASEALPLMERTLDPQHPALAVARVHAGAAQWSAGAGADGERLVRAGLATLEARFPNGHADLATAWLATGDLLRQSGRSAEARTLLQKALAWRKAHFGAADPRTVDVTRLLSTTKP